MSTAEKLRPVENGSRWVSTVAGMASWRSVGEMRQAPPAMAGSLHGREGCPQGIGRGTRPSSPGEKAPTDPRLTFDTAALAWWGAPRGSPASRDPIGLSSLPAPSASPLRAVPG